MKRVNGKHFYAFDLATFIQAFSQEDIIREKLTDSGAKDISIRIDNTEAGFDVYIERSMPADVPSLLRAVIGEWNHIKQREQWSGSIASGYDCELDIEIIGVPASIKGQMEITTSGVLTTNIVNIEVSCGIPLLGGQLERFVAKDVEKSVAKEFSFIKKRLG